MKYLLALMLVTTAANAECVQWGRDQYGNRVCMASDLVNRNPVFPEPQRVLPRDGEATISSHQPRCEEGWALVAAPQPMCARELKEPK